MKFVISRPISSPMYARMSVLSRTLCLSPMSPCHMHRQIPPMVLVWILLLMASGVAGLKGRTWMSGCLKPSHPFKQEQYYSLLQEARKRKETCLRTTGKGDRACVVHTIGVLSNRRYGSTGNNSLQKACEPSCRQVGSTLQHDHELDEVSSLFLPPKKCHSVH